MKVATEVTAGVRVSDPSVRELDLYWVQAPDEHIVRVDPMVRYVTIVEELQSMQHLQEWAETRNQVSRETSV